MFDDQNKGFDPKVLMAVVTSVAVLITWQYYLSVKYPNIPKKTETAVQTTPDQAAVSSSPGIVQNAEAPQKNVPTPLIVIPETLSSVRLGSISFDLSSKGMAIKNYRLDDYTDRSGVPIGFGAFGGIFVVSDSETGRPLDFKITEVSEGVYEGLHSSSLGTVKQTLSFDSSIYKITSRLEILSQTLKGVSISFSENVLAGSSSFLLPSFDHTEIVYQSEGSTSRTTLALDSEEQKFEYNNSQLLALGTQYFVSALLSTGQISPNIKASMAPNAQLVDLSAHFPFAGMAKNIELSYVGYIGPKAFKTLEKVAPEFGEIVNFGFFAQIAKVLLFILRWCYELLGNWGLSIIALTIIVRIVVLPFVLMSFKSMKKMQKIQPLIAELRERYKDKPQQLNTEMMDLMRKNKVNPVGGCLPMLLQLPVFFALYQVLGQSIELYKAPFIFWIKDLSAMDPYFVLPVLMGVSMYVQQKITPSTMDPMQAKVLQFMPILFSLMMISLPSGLTLYIFVSTFFGIVQQYIFMKDKDDKKDNVIDAVATRI